MFGVTKLLPYKWTHGLQRILAASTKFIQSDKCLLCSLPFNRTGESATVQVRNSSENIPEKREAIFRREMVYPGDIMVVSSSCSMSSRWVLVSSGPEPGGPPFPSRFVPFSRQCQWKSCALDQQWVITGLKYDKRWTCDHRVPVLCSIVSLDLLSNASVHSFAAWAFCSFVLCAQFFQSKVRIVTKHLVFVLGWLSTVALVTTTEGVGSFARCYTAKHISTVKISIILGDFSVSPIPEKTAISY